MAGKKKIEKEEALAPEKAEPIADSPNVIWADKQKEPPAQVRIGMTPVPLPDAPTQKEGFHSPFARRLVRSIKGYKEIVKKG